MIYRNPARRPAAAPLVLMLLVTAACAGGDTYAVDEAKIARSFLPPVRELSHHPDTLVHLAIVEQDGKTQFELEESYEELLRAWSCTWQSPEVSAVQNQANYFQTFATLWSLELSLASLEPERGIQNLSRDLARRMIEERKEDYREFLQIDIYRFLESPYTGGGLSDLRLDGAGRRVLLEDDRGNTYAPVRIETGLPRETFRPGGSSLYGRNALYFERVVDGEDILDDVERLRLTVREASPSIRYSFTWTFPQEEQAASTQENP